MNLEQTFLDDDKSIYIVKNVLSAEDLLVLQEYCSKDNDWYNHENVEKTLFYIKHLRPRVFSILQEKIYESVIQKLETELISQIRMPLLKHSAENTVTNDYGVWSIAPNSSDHSIIKNFTFFINDNYTGGEFVFIHKGIEVKPEANSLLIHLSSHLCGSKEISDGYAYTYTEYLCDKDQYQEWLQR
jgi:hypothetical protein